MKNRSFLAYRNILLPFLLLIIILAAFWNVQHHDFIDDFDDDLYVTDNPNINSGLSLKNMKWAFTAKVASNWHPLTLFSHMLDCHLFGLDSGKHHLTNLFFHMMNTLLLFIVLMRMTNSPWQSFMVSALFGLHPLHVESVAWISERKDVLSTLFWLLTVLCYAWYTKRTGIKRYSFVLLFFVLGLMSKPMVVTLPFVLILLDYWPLNRLDLKASKKHYLSTENKATIFRLIWEKIPLFLLSAVASIITFRFQKYTGDAPIPDLYPLGFRISNAIISYVKYIYKLFVPLDLSILYPYPNQLPDIHILFAFLVLALITLMVVLVGVRHKFFPVGWFWYLGTLVPVIGIVKIGTHSMADRYMYIPSIGLFIIMVWGVSWLLARWRFKVPFLAILSVFLILFLSSVTWLQVRHWSNSITLFEHAVEVDATNTLAHHHLGITMAQYGLFDETVRHTSEALRISQNMPPGRRITKDRSNVHYARTYYALGKSWYRKGNIDAAIVFFKEALLADPNHSEARDGYEAALDVQRKEIEAASKTEEALKMDPGNYELHMRLGDFYRRRGKLIMAQEQYVNALSIKHDHVEALMKIAEICAIRGRYSESVFYYKEAANFQPDYEEAYYALATIYARRRKIEESIDWLKKAVEKGYDDWDRMKKDNRLKAIRETQYYMELMKRVSN